MTTSEHVQVVKMESGLKTLQGIGGHCQGASWPFGKRELKSSVMIAVRVYHKEGRWWGGGEWTEVGGGPSEMEAEKRDQLLLLSLNKHVSERYPGVLEKGSMKSI